MTQKGLFTDVVERVERITSSRYKRFKTANNYRSAIGDDRCKTCKYLQSVKYHNKQYYKCVLIGNSMSTASNISLKNVCNRFEKQ